MGFYYGSGGPPEPEKGGTLKEALVITGIVFRTLALPVGILLAAILALSGLFFLFAWEPLAGLAVILLVVAGIVARAIWEARHPPRIPDDHPHR